MFFNFFFFFFFFFFFVVVVVVVVVVVFYCFSIFISDNHFIQQSRIILAILVKGHKSIRGTLM